MCSQLKNEFNFLYTVFTCPVYIGNILFLANDGCLANDDSRDQGSIHIVNGRSIHIR